MDTSILYWPVSSDGSETLLSEAESTSSSHHFQDEYRKFLNLYAVDYDERYVWDKTDRPRRPMPPFQGSGSIATEPGAALLRRLPLAIIFRAVGAPRFFIELSLDSFDYDSMLGSAASGRYPSRQPLGCLQGLGFQNGVGDLSLVAKASSM